MALWIVVDFSSVIFVDKRHTLSTFHILQFRLQKVLLIGDEPYKRNETIYTAGDNNSHHDLT